MSAIHEGAPRLAVWGYTVGEQQTDASLAWSASFTEARDWALGLQDAGRRAYVRKATRDEFEKVNSLRSV